MARELADEFAVLELMCALQECELLPNVPASAKAGLSRLQKSALQLETGSEFVAVYRSTPAISHRKDLKKLLDQSQRNNARLGISGVLLYYEMTFLQVLEGEEQVVLDLIKRIGADPRHTGMEVIYTHNEYTRVFQDWSMEIIGMSSEEFEGVMARLSKSGTVAKNFFSGLQPRPAATD